MEISAAVDATMEVSARGEQVAPRPLPPITAVRHKDRSAPVATVNGTTIGIIIAKVVHPPPMAKVIAAQITKRIAGVTAG